MDATEHCLDLIKRHDEDLFLSIGYAWKADRARLAALFALQAELRRIPEIVSEAPLGEIRLAWWREALDEAAGEGKLRAHPTLEALRHSGAMKRAGARALAERLVDARARLLYGEAFSSAREFKAFLSDAEVPLALLALGAAPAARIDAVRQHAEDYALARFAPVFAANVAQSDPTPARQRLKLDPEEAGSLAYLALARGYRRRTDGRPWPIGKRLALFRAIVSGAV